MVLPHPTAWRFVLGEGVGGVDVKSDVTSYLKGAGNQWLNDSFPGLEIQSQRRIDPLKRPRILIYLLSSL